MLRCVRTPHGIAFALMLAAACRPAGESKQAAPGVAVKTAPAIPPEWSGLGIPSKGLLRVRPETDAHGYYADYAGQDRAALTSEVARGLWAAGYAQACSADGGDVIGFVKGDRRLAFRVDVAGSLSLSMFDAEREPRLHGLCFGPPSPTATPR